MLPCITYSDIIFSKVQIQEYYIEKKNPKYPHTPPPRAADMTWDYKSGEMGFHWDYRKKVGIPEKSGKKSFWDSTGILHKVVWDSIGNSEINSWDSIRITENNFAIRWDSINIFALCRGFYNYKKVSKKKC